MRTHYNYKRPSFVNRLANGYSTGLTRLICGLVLTVLYGAFSLLLLYQTGEPPAPILPIENLEVKTLVLWSGFVILTVALLYLFIEWLVEVRVVHKKMLNVLPRLESKVLAQVPKCMLVSRAGTITKIDGYAVAFGFIRLPKGIGVIWEIDADVDLGEIQLLRTDAIGEHACIHSSQKKSHYYIDPRPVQNPKYDLRFSKPGILLRSISRFKQSSLPKAIDDGAGIFLNEGGSYRSEADIRLNLGILKRKLIDRLDFQHHHASYYELKAEDQTLGMLAVDTSGDRGGITFLWEVETMTENPLMIFRDDALLYESSEGDEEFIDQQLFPGKDYSYEVFLRYPEGKVTINCQATESAVIGASPEAWSRRTLSGYSFAEVRRMTDVEYRDFYEDEVHLLRDKYQKEISDKFGDVSSWWGHWTYRVGNKSERPSLPKDMRAPEPLVIVLGFIVLDLNKIHVIVRTPDDSQPIFVNRYTVDRKSDIIINDTDYMVSSLDEFEGDLDKYYVSYRTEKNKFAVSANVVYGRDQQEEWEKSKKRERVNQLSKQFIDDEREVLEQLIREKYKGDYEGEDLEDKVEEVLERYDIEKDNRDTYG